MKKLLIVVVLLGGLQADRCDDAMENAVKICMKFADTGYGYKKCIVADNTQLKYVKENRWVYY